MKIKTIILFGTALLLTACKQGESQQPTGEEYPLLTLKPTDRELSVKYSAVIEGKQDVEIRPQVSGILTRVCVEEGARVRKGEVLFVIDQVPYQAALQKARATVATAEANFATARLNLEGKEDLFRNKVVSDFDLRTTQNACKSAEAALLQAQAELRDAANNLSYTEVKSPVDGFAGMTSFRVGALVSPTMSEPLISVSDNSDMYVYFSLTEKQGYLMNTTKTGLAPNEDTGAIFINLDAPAGNTLAETAATMHRVEEILMEVPQIEDFSMVAGQGGASHGMFIIRLKHWDERPGKENSLNAVCEEIYRRTEHIKSANLFVYSSPMIGGYGSGNNFEIYVQDRAGKGVDALSQVTNRFIEELNKRPEIQMALTSFSANFPQYRVDIDEAKCQRYGTTTGEMLDVLSGYLGSVYASNFNRFTKLYRVIMQAPSESRSSLHSLDNIFVKTTGGMTREEQQNAGSYDTAIIYGVCILFIYLILCALYESLFVPLAVILSVPFGLMGSFLFARLWGLENNIYLQTGFIMLIGLLSKTAILLTEYATERRKAGMSLTQAAMTAASVRLRPILMTALTMVFGLLPLMFASGVGANGNSTLGVGAVGGMLVGTIALLFVTPVFFITFQYVEEKVMNRKGKR